MKRKLPPDDEVAAIYASGVPQKQIAHRFGCQVSSVSLAIARHNVRVMVADAERIKRDGGWDILPTEYSDRDRLLAISVALQQKAGFGSRIDIREWKCPRCGDPGFNSGWGAINFVCGGESVGDEFSGCTIPKTAFITPGNGGD